MAILEHTSCRHDHTLYILSGLLFDSHLCYCGQATLASVGLDNEMPTQLTLTGRDEMLVSVSETLL
jgi:hypothetical protein